MTTKRKSAERKRADVPRDFDVASPFRGLGNLVDLIGRLAAACERPVERRGEFRIKGLGDQARGVYELSVRSIGDWRRLYVAPNDTTNLPKR